MPILAWPLPELHNILDFIVKNMIFKEGNITLKCLLLLDELLQKVCLRIAVDLQIWAKWVEQHSANCKMWNDCLLMILSLQWETIYIVGLIIEFMSCQCRRLKMEDLKIEDWLKIEESREYILTNATIWYCLTHLRKTVWEAAWKTHWC